MQKWTKQIELPADQTVMTLSQLMQQWSLPRRIRGQLRQNKRVLLNGNYQPVSTLIQPRDKVSFTFLATDFRHSQSGYEIDHRDHLDILYENPDFMIANKPGGIKTHPNSPGEVGTLLNFVQGYLQKATGKAAYMVHRLDEGTSGAIIIAKVPFVVPMLNAQLKTKRIQRTYLAWVKGRMEQAAGTIKMPIGRHPSNDRLRQIGGLAAQDAVTHWQLLETRGSTSLLQIQLETGRTHQIRVHLAALGHPLLGDRDYNPKAIDRRLQLHSSTVSLILPFSQTDLTVKAPLPADFIHPSV